MKRFLFSNTKLVGKSKIFFLHIPKTAGTSVNIMLAGNYRKKSVKFHIENDRSEQFKNINTNYHQMISGHIRLYEVTNFLDIEDFLCVTLLRDPFDQLISHLNWVKFISEKPQGLFFGNHAKPIKELSLEMRKVNFSILSEVELFFNNLPDIGNELFNNCQTKYLANYIVSSKLSIDDAANAIESLSFFDIIGTVENMESFMNEICLKMGWHYNVSIPKMNVSKTNTGIDKNLPGLREALYPLYCADQVVYDHVSK